MPPQFESLLKVNKIAYNKGVNYLTDREYLAFISQFPKLNFF